MEKDEVKTVNIFKMLSFQTSKYLEFSQKYLCCCLFLSVLFYGCTLSVPNSDSAQEDSAKSAEPPTKEYFLQHSYYINMEGNRTDKKPPHVDVPDLSYITIIDQSKISIPKGCMIESLSGLIEDRAKVLVKTDKGEHRFGFVDEKGAWITEPIFVCVNDFSEGLAAVMYPSSPLEEDSSIDLPDKSPMAYPVQSTSATIHYISTAPGTYWGYIDRNGHVAIKKVFTEAGSFVNGIAPVSGIYQKSRRVRTGFIDKTGLFVQSSPEWLGIKGISEGLTPVAVSVSYGFLFWHREDEKWGFMDLSGRMIIPPQFDDANSFSNGFAAVAKGDKWGYINREGILKIDYRFKSAGSFLGDVSFVMD